MSNNNFQLKALAWDDKPDVQLNKLKSEFERRYATQLVITEDEGEFFDYYNNQGNWDFIVLDVIDDQGVRTGPNLARRIREANGSNSEIPIIFLTIDDSIILKDEINISSPILIKSKGISSGLLALDITNYVKSLKYDDKKVFLIYGHGKKASGFREKVEAELKKHQLEPILLTPDQVMNGISEGLVNKMKECGTFIAICTPDDKVDDNWYQPRQNVLLEIGIAMGLAKGFTRLVILQRWGATPDTQAKLPSDLGGILTIRFSDDDLDSVIQTMLKALEARKMKVIYPN